MNMEITEQQLEECGEIVDELRDRIREAIGGAYFAEASGALACILAEGFLEQASISLDDFVDWVGQMIRLQSAAELKFRASEAN